MAKPYIGIKQIFYGAPFAAAVTPASLKTWLQAGTTKEVKNSHDGTWGYSQDDPEVTDYINELTGKPYYRDKTNNGQKTITFTIGVYDYEDKVALQGGSLVTETPQGGSDPVTIGWKSPTSPELINKAIVGVTKTGHYVVFTNASIVGKVDTQEKNLGLGITAVAMDSEVQNVSDEYWIDADAMVEG